MAFESVDSFGIRVVTIYTAFTCICIPLILILLVYTQNLYNIGKFTCIPVLFAIILTECIKLGWHMLLKDETPTAYKESKSSRMKKCCGKIKLKEICKCQFAMIAITFVYFISAILFGASISNQHEETLMLSALITMLTVFPGCIHVGVDVTLSLLAGMKPVPGDLLTEMIQRNIQCTIFGAWFGAIVIPLDWNRPWQVWPIPCSLGAIIGYTAAHIIALITLTPSIAKLLTKKEYGKNVI